MAQATFFNYATGRITGSIACSESAFWLNVEGRDWIAGSFDGDKYYVDAKEYRPVPRPEMEGVTVEGNIVSGLPVPCEVECNGETYAVDDGEFEYDTPLAGTYPFRVRAFPALDFAGELTVTPPEEDTAQMAETPEDIEESSGTDVAETESTEEATENESTTQTE